MYRANAPLVQDQWFKAGANPGYLPLHYKVLTRVELTQVHPRLICVVYTGLMSVALFDVIGFVEKDLDLEEKGGAG